MNEAEFEILETEHGIFTSNPEKGLTAQQVYNGWLKSKATLEDAKSDELELGYVKSNKELQEENKKLKAQLEATAKNQEFIETCLMEMAQVVYA